MTKESRIIFGEIPTSLNGAFLLNPEEVSAWEKNINSKLPDGAFFIPTPFKESNVKMTNERFIELEIKNTIDFTSDAPKYIKTLFNIDHIVSVGVCSRDKTKGAIVTTYNVYETSYSYEELRDKIKVL